jgi:hypothetical protein
LHRHQSRPKSLPRQSTERTSPEASVNKSSSKRIDVSEKVLESALSRFMAIHDQPNDNFGTL